MLKPIIYSLLFFVTAIGFVGLVLWKSILKKSIKQRIKMNQIDLMLTHTLPMLTNWASKETIQLNILPGESINQISEILYKIEAYK